MTILFDPSKPVRPSTARPFAAGLAPAPRERRAPYTAADAQWWAENSPTRNDGYEVLIPAPAPIRGGSPDAGWDALAFEAMAQARLDRGLCL
jgi:hypothetical protein